MPTSDTTRSSTSGTTAYRIPALPTSPPPPPLATLPSLATPPLWQPEVISFELDPLKLAPELTFLPADSTLSRLPLAVNGNDDGDGGDNDGSSEKPKQKEKQKSIGQNGDSCSLASSGGTIPGERIFCSL